MICKMCQQAGDASLKSKDTVGREEKDYLAKAQTLHAKCNNASCYCQHRK